MTNKRHLFAPREITDRTYSSYLSTCDTVIKILGKDRLLDDLQPAEFGTLRASLAKTLNPVSLGNAITRIHMIFKFALDEGIIEQPVRCGQSFGKPSKKTLRIERQQKGPRMFEAVELRKILKEAPQPLKSMVLMRINCGFGQTDLSNMPQQIINFETGWIDYPRVKTGVERRCHLWPETLETLEEAIKKRPKAKSTQDRELCFITKYGLRWVKKNDDAVAKQFSKLLTKLELKRPGLNFYALRHTFETIAGECRDQVAVDHIMGHSRNDMASLYRERISDERLKDAAEFVRKWLLGIEE